MKKPNQLKQKPMRPAAIDEIAQRLIVQALWSTGSGIFLIVVSNYVFEAQFFGLGLGLVILGSFIVLIAIEFSRLHRWSYGFAKILVSPWFRSDWLSFLVWRDLSKKISSPDVQRAFGIKPEEKEQ